MSPFILFCILQAGEEKYRKAWAHICEISRRGYEKVYQRLGVHLEEKVLEDFVSFMLLLMVHLKLLVRYSTRFP